MENINISVGSKYDVTVAKSDTSFRVTIPSAKLYAVNMEDNTPEMIFHYGVCQGVPQSIRLRSGHIQSIIESVVEDSVQ